MDPITLLGAGASFVPTLTGGPTGPSKSDSGAFSQGTYFGNSFAVGKGARAEATTTGSPTSATPTGLPPSIQEYIPWIIAGVVALVAVGAFTRGRK